MKRLPRLGTAGPMPIKAKLTVAAAAGLAFAFWTGAAGAATVHVVALARDYASITLLEPAAFSTPSPGHRRASLVVVDVLGGSDITEFELDCAQPRLKVLTEKLYDDAGKFEFDKTGQNTLDWVDYPATSQMESNRKYICGYPASRNPKMEFTGPDFWQLLGAIRDSLVDDFLKAHPDFPGGKR